MDPSCLSPARQTRAKRLSHDEEPDQAGVLPSPKQSVAFVTSHSTTLLATYCFALIWFAQVARMAQVSSPALATHAQGSPDNATAQYWSDFGLFVATGGRGLGLNYNMPIRGTSVLQSAKRFNVQRAATVDPGLVLATGSVGLLLSDVAREPPLAVARAAPARAPPVAARSPNPAATPATADPGLVLATGSAGLLLSDLAREPPLARRPFAAAAAKLAALPRPPVAPKVAEPELEAVAPPDTNAFVFTCAFVHTFIVCIGFALGSDTLADMNWRAMLARTTIGAFAFMAVALWMSWEYSVGPWPAVGRLLFSSEASYVLIGAQSMCMWLACSMLLPHAGRFGKLCTDSRSLHSIITTIGVGLYLLDMPTAGVLACFGTFLAAMPSAKLAATRSMMTAECHM